LGIDAERWLYQTPTVDLHLIDLLDDAVFEWWLLQQSPAFLDTDSQARLNQLQRTIERYSSQIFGEAVPPHALETAWRHRGDPCRRNSESYSDAGNIPDWVDAQGAYLARGGEGSISELPGSHGALPDTHLLPSLRVPAGKGRRKGEPPSQPHNTAERVLMEYLYDMRTIRKFIQIEPVDVSHQAPNIRRVQSILRNVLTKKGLTIESNPTSNWLIGGFERHADVPAIQWQLYHPEVAMTINPDDPTVFSTSIENEYLFMYSTLVHGAPQPLDQVETLRRISQLRVRAIEASFLD
jgi:hypothetical protein